MAGRHRCRRGDRVPRRAVRWRRLQQLRPGRNADDDQFQRHGTHGQHRLQISGPRHRRGGQPGPYSTTVNATTSAAPDTTPPTAPGTPVPTVVSSTQINLTWPAATDAVGVTGYRVERCAGTGCSNFTQVGTPTTTSFSDTGLTPSTDYSYQVRATDAAGNLGPYSAIATASTPAPDTTPPTAPGTPTLTVVSSSQIEWPGRPPPTRLGLLATGWSDARAPAAAASRRSERRRLRASATQDSRAAQPTAIESARPTRPAIWGPIPGPPAQRRQPARPRLRSSR